MKNLSLQKAQQFLLDGYLNNALFLVTIDYIIIVAFTDKISKTHINLC